MKTSGGFIANTTQLIDERIKMFNLKNCFVEIFESYNVAFELVSVTFGYLRSEQPLTRLLVAGILPRFGLKEDSLILFSGFWLKLTLLDARW